VLNRLITCALFAIVSALFASALVAQEPSSSKSTDKPARPKKTDKPTSPKRSEKRTEEPAFAKRIKDVVNPRFEGEQFGEGSVLQKLEDRYNANFQVGTGSFDDMFGSDNVGGILLRSYPEKPVKVLHLTSASFKLEPGDLEMVHFRLGTDTEQLDYRVPATIVPAAALMAADQRLVLLTLSCGSARSHVDLAATHPAIVNHQLGYMAAQLDLSLTNVMGMGHGRNYLLCEKAWHLSLKSLSAREDLFTVRCRIDNIETTPPGITDAFRSRLGSDQKRYFRVLNNFVTVRRLVRSVIGHYITGFPEDDFIKLLKQLQPIYEKQKMTKEQAEEMHLMLTKF
jgi:hypothetical protein